MRADHHVHPVQSLSPVEMIALLREVALRCIQLARESADGDVVHGFEELSIELATRATNLEAVVNRQAT